MAVRHCDKFLDCPGTDFPITNYSAEGPEDPPRFYALTFPTETGIIQQGCLGDSSSTISQFEANLAALAVQALCPNEGPIDPNECGDGEGVPNQPQTCTATCANGSVYHYTLPAGTVTGSCQTTADAQAAAMACEDAEETPCCLGSIDTGCCLGSPYSSTITATGGSPILFEVESGALPNGLNLSADGVISGTPTSPGQATFTIKATLANGNYTTRQYDITISFIITAFCADGSVGTAYTQVLSGIGGVAWSRTAGTLPPGLALVAGMITGTPTTAGTYNFTLHYGECSKALSITVTNPFYAYWKCEEFALPIIDSTGNTNLTYLAGYLTVAPGKILLGLALEGPSGTTELRTGTTTRFRFAGSFTIRFWYFENHAGSGFNLFYNDASGDYSFKIEGNTGPGTNGINWSVWDASNTEQTVNPTGGAFLSVGWHRVIVWYDATLGQIGAKIDNDASVTAAQAGGIYATAGDELVICAPGFGSLLGYIIDEIAIWDRVLTAAEMLADWGNPPGSGTTYPQI